MSELSDADLELDYHDHGSEEGSAEAQGASDPGFGINGSTMDARQLPEPLYNMPPMGIPSMTPVTAPRAFPPLFYQRADHPPPLGSGKRGFPEIERLALALRSGVPDEVDWAISGLLDLSANHADIFTPLPPKPPHGAGSHAPVTSVVSVQYQVASSRGKKLLRGVTQFLAAEWPRALGASYEALVRRQKVSEALLILRNAALDASTAELLASSDLGGRSIIERGLALPDTGEFSELRILTLEIAEHVCFHFSSAVSTDSLLFKGLVACLSSSDRAVLVTSLRSLSRLCVNDARDGILSLTDEQLKKLLHQLLVDDSELVAATLDLLYQYTARLQSFDTFQGPKGLWVQDILTRHLVRLLAWKMEREPLDYIRLAPRAKRPVPAEPPTLPDSILNELLVLPEPERALNYIRAAYEPDPDAEVTQVSLWNAYQHVFEPHQRSSGKRLLRAIDYIRQASSVFTTAEAAVITMPTGEKKFIIRGFRPREKAVSPNSLNLPAARRRVPPPAFAPTAALVLQNLAKLRGGRQVLQPLVPDIISAASLNKEVWGYVDCLLTLLA